MKRVLGFMDSLSPTELSYLAQIMGIVNMVNSIQSQFMLSDEEMAKKLKVSKPKFIKMRKGAYDFDLLTLAKLKVIAKEEFQQSKTVQIKVEENKK